MPSLIVLQSLWAMDDDPAAGAERSLEQKVEAVAAAGYDGISVDYLDMGQIRRIDALVRSSGMPIEGQCTPHTIDDLKPILEMASQTNTHHLAVQPATSSESTSECIRLLEGWLHLAEQVAFPVLIETHRGRMTNDLQRTLRLIDSLPAMRLAADLSHYVVAHEIELPVPANTHAQIHKILEAAQAFHGRVASSEQVQIELSFPQHRKWVDLFLQWWDHGFRAWRSRAAEHDTLSFTCELGPKPYAITGRDGHDSTDRWAESLTLARMVRARWQAISDQALPQPVAKAP